MVEKRLYIYIYMRYRNVPSKGWENMYCANKKITDVTILTSHKADFQARSITRDKERYFIIAKNPIQKKIEQLQYYMQCITTLKSKS